MKRLFLLFAVMLGVAMSSHAMFWQLKYRGTVAGSTIEVALNYNTGDAATNGRPYWIENSHARYPKVNGNVLTLEPKTSADSKNWIFDEYYNGKRTGRWALRQAGDGDLKGTFTNAKTGKKYTVYLRSVKGSNEWDWAY